MSRGSGILLYAPETLDLLAGKAFELLERHGVKMEHAATVRRLADAGATVDADAAMVRLPRALVEDAVDKAPKTFRPTFMPGITRFRNATGT